MTEAMKSGGEGGVASPFSRVCVIGSGVMGAGIAAQIANAGVPVLLLDRKAEGSNPNALADGAIAKALKADPAAFMDPAAAKLITTGTIEDDLGKVADCDWVVEVIIERLDLKQGLYRRLDEVRRPGTPVSSNTSTIPLARLVEGMPERFARDFLITHFFNPPRYMRLLEIVGGPLTDPAHVARLTAFCDRSLGKTVVKAKDTPGFIANRIGTFWMQVAAGVAVEQGLTVEEVDAVIGRPFGIPKTGVFGLLDLVGIDLMPHIAASMTSLLAEGDRYHAFAGELPLVPKMIADGYTGRKGKGGFYRINREGGGKVKESIDLKTGAYAPSRRASLPPEGRDAAGLLGAQDRLGAYARKVMGETLAYAASLVPEISDDISGIDRAMELGFNWKMGPFALIDQIGAAKFAALLKQEGIAVPALIETAGDRKFYKDIDGVPNELGADGEYRPVPRPEGVLLLSDVRRKGKPVLSSKAGALWDIGDGVACFEITTKMNTFEERVLAILEKSIEHVKENFKALVIYTDATQFSAGANLGLAQFAANMAAFGEIKKLIARGQTVFKSLKYAPFPVVAAPAGLALGGGCEITLHADAIQAHAESYIGLVECGVGLIPGWGGCGEMLLRLAADKRTPKGPMPPVREVFEMIATARVSKSAAEARRMHILRDGDGITMNRDRLLADAKARALALVDGYTPPAKPEFHPAGAGGKLALNMAVDGMLRQGIATPHDVTVAGWLATILTGGDHDMTETLTEEQVLGLEQEAFYALVQTVPTLDRIEHMLETGKPLRN
ncbi:3-hydroxyacyl-CoA dehydrogenase/enoyl-CoA hydratase family protein [Acidomonas methanolica]|uniref:3-hydroxyacyl-CoA dehydrogenase n=1 Tax=Acidomonas methanolica NBRC 104435 TaxID=1231351 RepID=A0A023D245_ACIMT|nr:3-hydroxyacyl-CoA dehydrogenase/enoyl-CoA hydratase family protein [Acidomonas methanolica]TCS30657.1 3-hydroxyacyl-CoA dehydrogenase [Acidomonas methanolica]GAJ28213.1 3-hydroxyacyl-CoA dehydrogenase [Acidomonas methanolica NBRC 104435]GEK98955.1 3-hydroxyacyl-CoA dehydrogenase [Acidomonas methanolica NBRC 104435]